MVFGIRNRKGCLRYGAQPVCRAVLRNEILSVRHRECSVPQGSFPVRQTQKCTSLRGAFLVFSVLGTDFSIFILTYEDLRGKSKTVPIPCQFYAIKFIIKFHIPTLFLSFPNICCLLILLSKKIFFLYILLLLCIFYR